MLQVKTCWTESLDSFASNRLRKTFATYFCGKGGDVGRSLLQHVLADSLHDLVNFTVDYTVPWDISQLRAVRQVLAFYQKSDDIDIGIDREAVAYNSFLESERRCGLSNAFFRSVRRGSISMLPVDTVIFHNARLLIRRTLGKAPVMESLKLRFGPGATSSVKKTNASPAIKLAETPTCSAELLSYGVVPELSRCMPHWLDCHAADYTIDSEDYLVAHLNVKLETARLQFVPKNAKTHRAIDTQPTLNTLVQGGIGAYMLRRLKAAGIDLKDQSRNKRLAQQASIDGLNATVDLSNASDLISTELVRDLLPEDWFALLSSCRAGCTVYKGKEIILEKFCAMGNGYTFPLESLIFWALTFCACLHVRPEGQPCSVSVYGDDLVIPTWGVEASFRILTTAGFVVNKDKSYWRGGFRESCGGDYYFGHSIRPYYSREAISGRTLFTMHNFFYRLGDLEFCALVKKAIPTSIRLYGPDGYGDGHLITDDFQLSLSRKLLSRGWRGGYFSTYNLVGRWISTPYFGDYVTPLYSVYIKEREEDPHPIDGNVEPHPLTSEVSPTEFQKNGRPKWPVPRPSDCLLYEKKSIYVLQR